MTTKKLKIAIIIVIAILLLLICIITIFLPSKSFIITNENKKVSFFVPKSLKENTSFSDSTVRIFEKQIRSNPSEKININITSYDYTVDYYMKDYIEKQESSIKRDYGSETTSDILTKTINYNNISYRTIEYKNSAGKEEYELYSCFKLDKTNEIYVIEVKGQEKLTDRELESLFNIDIKKSR